MKQNNEGSVGWVLSHTYLNTEMMKILAVLKLSGGVVFVCWQQLTLIQVTDRFNGQVE